MGKKQNKGLITLVLYTEKSLQKGEDLFHELRKRKIINKSLKAEKKANERS